MPEDVLGKVEREGDAVLSQFPVVAQPGDERAVGGVGADKRLVHVLDELEAGRVGGEGGVERLEVRAAGDHDLSPLDGGIDQPVRLFDRLSGLLAAEGSGARLGPDADPAGGRRRLLGTPEAGEEGRGQAEGAGAQQEVAPIDGGTLQFVQQPRKIPLAFSLRVENRSSKHSFTHQHVWSGDDTGVNSGAGSGWAP